MAQWSKLLAAQSREPEFKSYHSKVSILQKPIILAPRWMETRGLRETTWLLHKNMHIFVSCRPLLFLCLVFVWASWWLSSQPFLPITLMIREKKKKTLLQKLRDFLFVLSELFERKFSLPASYLDLQPVGSGSLHPCRQPQLQPRNSNTSGNWELGLSQYQ